MSINFTSEGYLTPVEKITTDLHTFEQIFVTNFPDSNTRPRLWANYLKFLTRFKQKITGNFVQWVNGSFVTLKENPNDIDILTFIDYRIFEPMETQQFLEEFWSYNLEKEGLDSYLIGIYPENHLNFEDYNQKLKEWTKIYQSAKINGVGKRNMKGFLELKFSIQ